MTSLAVDLNKALPVDLRETLETCLKYRIGQFSLEHKLSDKTYVFTIIFDGSQRTSEPSVQPQVCQSRAESCDTKETGLAEKFMGNTTPQSSRLDTTTSTIEFTWGEAVSVPTTSQLMLLEREKTPSRSAPVRRKKKKFSKQHQLLQLPPNIKKHQPVEEKNREEDEEEDVEEEDVDKDKEEDEETPDEEELDDEDPLEFTSKLYHLASFHMESRSHEHFSVKKKGKYFKTWAKKTGVEARFFVQTFTQKNLRKDTEVNTIHEIFQWAEKEHAPVQFTKLVCLLYAYNRLFDLEGGDLDILSYEEICLVKTLRMF